EMFFHRVADLHAPPIIAHPADLLPDPHREAVGEADEFSVRLGVDFRDRVALGVGGAFVRTDEKVVAVLDGDRPLLGTVRPLHMNTNLRLDGGVINDALNADERIIGAARRGSAGNYDLLPEPR